MEILKSDLYKVFRSKMNLEELEKNEAPSSIIKNQRKNLQRHIEILFKKYEFIFDTYIKTIKGNIEYMEYVSSEKHEDSINDRCCSCEFYGYYLNNSISNTTKFSCSKFDDIPMHCNSCNLIYDKDIFVPRMIEANNQCENCNNSINENIPFLDIKELTCTIKGKNSFNCDCYTPRIEENIITNN